MKAGLSGSSVSASNEGRCILPTPETKATIWMPCAAVRYSSAMAPAATRPARRGEGMRASEQLLAKADELEQSHTLMVSRADERPPPLLALMPYLAR